MAREAFRYAHLATLGAAEMAAIYLNLRQKN
jgi:hypothetical protein